MKSWGIYLLVALGFVAYNAITEADRDSSGAIVGEGSVDAFQVQVGDCFNDSSSFDEISSLPGVPCSDPHDNEAFAVFDVSVAAYPGEDAMGELANTSCIERFEAFVGKDYESSALDVFTMYPSTDSWIQDDREVVCAVYDMNAAKLVGSAKGRSL
ncbi:MAG: hypothetical protein GXP15_06825 [Gammaproteobacteria bacterium]|nr:hypothetical protein [Gammaproteobacteria bacterium]